MTKDLSPEEIDVNAEVATSPTLDETALTDDVYAQPGPEDLDGDDTLSPTAMAAASIDLSGVRWPSHDENAPDYAYLAHETAPNTFTLTPSVLEALLKLNRYEAYRDKKVIAFGLRGARLSAGNDVELADSVVLENVRPDHINFRCVIGFYFTETQKLTVYAASTVPCRRAVWGYANGGDKSNMLPTGLHTFYIWRHKQIKPALRMGKSKSDPESGAAATVLRTTNDTILATRDIFDLSVPYDNIHCSYYLTEQDHYGARFSSWGCLTVRGTKAPSAQWKKFQTVLTGLGEKERVDLLLATGKDAALVAAANSDVAALEPKLGALRRGSRGPEVERLQAKVGASGTGFFGAVTLDKFTGTQRAFNNASGNGPVADGIYSRAMETATNWGIF